MICSCGHKLKVTRTHDAERSVERARHCPSCKATFTTVEKHQDDIKAEMESLLEEQARKLRALIPKTVTPEPEPQGARPGYRKIPGWVPEPYDDEPGGRR